MWARGGRFERTRESSGTWGRGECTSMHVVYVNGLCRRRRRRRVVVCLYLARVVLVLAATGSCTGYGNSKGVRTQHL